MATLLQDMVKKVRKDLQDEDPANYLWMDDELERHIQHTVRELSQDIPQQLKTTIQTTASSRDLDISTITDRVMVESVEWPVDEYPPKFVRFKLWGNTITMMVDTPPAGIEDANIYYGKLHELTSLTTTIPEQFDDLVAIGASGYAAQTKALFIARLGEEAESAVAKTAAELRDWGTERLKLFREELTAHSRKSKIRSSQLYTRQ